MTSHCIMTYQKFQFQPEAPEATRRAAGAQSQKRALSPYLANKQKQISNLVGEAVQLHSLLI